jgi:thiaminase/transcriptional activator TenA
MAKIYALPFNQELALGTLALEKFIFYLSQDALYLTDFSKALALTATRLPHDHQTELFIQLALDAIKAERELHANILKKYASSMPKVSEPSPFCFMYTNYLLRMATTAEVEVAVASLSPCFWVYQQVGQKACAKKIAHNPYQAWIDLYSSTEFDHSVDSLIVILNELAENATLNTQKKMLSAFRRATQCEWQFWQGAYRQESWPI